MRLRVISILFAIRNGRHDINCADHFFFTNVPPDNDFTEKTLHLISICNNKILVYIVFVILYFKVNEKNSIYHIQ